VLHDSTDGFPRIGLIQFGVEVVEGVNLLDPEHVSRCHEFLLPDPTHCFGPGITRAIVEATPLPSGSGQQIGFDALGRILREGATRAE
jgi:hypothetical protein